jgi:hypothetical protein
MWWYHRIHNLPQKPVKPPFNLYLFDYFYVSYPAIIKVIFLKNEYTILVGTPII